MHSLKKIFLITLVLMFSIQTLCFAAGDEAKKPEKVSVALMFVNNAKTTYDNELTEKMMKNFSEVLDNSYNVIPGQRFIELLYKTGISDIATAERGDILDVFKGETIDYVLFAELQPFVRKERYTFFTQGIDMTAVIPVKIIDLKTGKYLYNGKFTEFASDSTMLGMVGNKSVSLKALDKVIEKINPVIKVRLPMTRDN